MAMPRSLRSLLAVLLLSQSGLAAVGNNIPPIGSIKGVNLGSWLVLEPWMMPNEWASMGGQVCGDCTTCISSEWDLVKSLGQSKADAVFEQHWTSWFNQSDVSAIQALGLNTVRIPIGYWIIESIVKNGEYYPQGGLTHLINGIEMLKQAGIWVILDMHAMPGTSSVYSQFAGRCVSKAGFYTSANYARGLQVSAALTALIHAHPSFNMTFSLQSVNEPLWNASQTPGLGNYYSNFVSTVRGTEEYLGMRCPSNDKKGKYAAQLPSSTKKLIRTVLSQQGLNVTYHNQVSSNLARQPGYDSCLYTSFMDATWQWTNPSTNNPSHAANGPILYDDHSYLSFGGVTSANPSSYLTYICNYNRFANNADLGDSKNSLFIGEWWIAAQWAANATFYQAFGDAQKLAYSQGAGWVYWSWKIEANNTVFTGSSQTEGVIRDYRQSVNAGYLTQDPAALFNPSVCQGYTASSRRRHSPRDPFMSLKDSWSYDTI